MTGELDRLQTASPTGDSHGRPNREHRRRGYLIITAAVTLLAFLLVILSTGDLLRVRPELKEAEVIIILGGEWNNRVQRAAELYNAGFAPKILITGRGDCYSIKSRLLEKNVPDSAIVVEDSSRTTQENAKFGAEYLDKQHLKKALIVTSGLHERRACAAFRHYAPAVRFFPAPAPNDWETRPIPRKNRLRSIASEYLKLAWYSVRYGISPFV